MEVLILLMFIGIVMVALMLTFFWWTVRAGSFQHADRLALLPLGDDDGRPARRPELMTRVGTDVEDADGDGQTSPDSVDRTIEKTDAQRRRDDRPPGAFATGHHDQLG